MPQGTRQLAGCRVLRICQLGCQVAHRGEPLCCSHFRFSPALGQHPAIEFCTRQAWSQSRQGTYLMHRSCLVQAEALLQQLRRVFRCKAAHLGLYSRWIGAHLASDGVVHIEPCCIEASFPTMWCWNALLHITSRLHRCNCVDGGSTTGMQQGGLCYLLVFWRCVRVRGTAWQQ